MHWPSSFLSLEYNAGMNKEIEKLEIKVSYLEEENAELNEIVIDMNKRLSVLMAQLLKLTTVVPELLTNFVPS